MNIREKLLTKFATWMIPGGEFIPDINAYLLRTSEAYGVAVPVTAGFDKYSDALNSLQFTVSDLKVGPKIVPVAYLACNDEALRSSFVDVCQIFLDEEKRSVICSDPKAWWLGMKFLTGNSLVNASPAFVFAEFTIFLYLTQKFGGKGNGVTVTWKSCGSTHDIEASDGSLHEVKSTLSHHESKIHVSSEFQLVSTGNANNLYFCRLEKGREDGKSIDELIDVAKGMGCDLGQIEKVLCAHGIRQFSDARRMKFALLEAKCYDVNDERFPKFSKSFWPGSIHLESIEDISYTINLASLEGCDISAELT